MCRLVQRIFGMAKRAATRALTFFETICPAFIRLIVRSASIQRQADELYQTLQSAELDAPSDRQRIRESLLDITLREAILPNQVLIDRDQITFSESSVEVLQTPNTDLYIGYVGHRPVHFKRYRVACESGSRSQGHRGNLSKAMINEVIMLSSFASPRVIPFEGVCWLGDNFDRVYLAQAPYDTIMAFLLARPHAERIPLLKDVADGLHYLHDSGVIHGGMSGATILVDDTGRAYLSDFSLAHSEGTHHMPSIQSMAGPIGNLAWLAPERLGGLYEDESTVSTRASDVYAFGCLAYLIFTGKDPFEELMTSSTSQPMAAFKIITAVCNDGVRPAKPEVGDDAFVKHGLTEMIWGSILEDCWERDPHSRPDAGELARRLSTHVAVVDVS